MKRDGKIVVVIIALFGIFYMNMAQATSGYQQALIEKYPELKNGQLNNCATCHMPIVSDFLNNYGLALKESVKQSGKVDFEFVATLDSDGDAVLNSDEIAKQTPPGSQATLLEQFEFTGKGTVSFDHASHSMNSSYFSSGKCQMCHSADGFPKMFNDKVSVKTQAHKLCLGCHKEQHAQGNTNPPKQCSECHN